MFTWAALWALLCSATIFSICSLLFMTTVTMRFVWQSVPMPMLKDYRRFHLLHIFWPHRILFW